MLQLILGDHQDEYEVEVLIAEKELEELAAMEEKPGIWKTRSVFSKLKLLYIQDQF